MSALLAGVCAGTAALAALHRPSRTGRLRRPSHGRPRPGTMSVLEAVGRACRAGIGRRPAPPADRRTGAALALLVVVAVAGPVPALVVLAAAVLHTRWRHLRASSAIDRARIQGDLPDLVDLLALAVGAGLSVPAALPVIAPVAPPSLRPDLLAAADAVTAGRSTDEAVVELGHRWGSPARPLVHALADHLRYGTPALPALERVAVEARSGRRRAAETRARRLPVLLLFPLVLCTLPAFGLLTVAPLVAGTFDSLSGSQLEAPASAAP